MAKKPASNCKKGKNYWHCPIPRAPKCAKGSIRTVTRGRNRIRVCCPTGKWKKNRCTVGTRGISKLVPI